MLIEAAVSVTQYISQYFSTPQAIIVTVIEFLLGFGVGYFLAKGLKYILAFFALLIVGDLLNIWSVSAFSAKSLSIATLQQELAPLSAFLSIIQPIFTNIIILIGFIIGAAVALLR